MAENKDKKKVKKFLKLLADSLDVKKDVSPSYLVTTFIKAVDTLPEGKLKNSVQSDSENCTRLLHSYVVKRRSQCDSLEKKKITSSSPPGDVQKSELRSVTTVKGKTKKADKSKKNKKGSKKKETIGVSQNKEPRNFAEIYLQELVVSSGAGVYPAAVKFLTDFLCVVEKKQEDIGLDEPVKVGELAEEIKTNLSICHLQYQQIRKVSSRKRPSYKDLVASLLSIYVDMMVLSARNEKKKKHIGQSVCSFVCYVAEQSHLLDILLQLTVIQPEDKKIVLPLVRRCLKLVSPEGSESTYLKYMLTVCSMHKIFSEVMAGVVTTARTVPAPDSFMKWLKDTSPSVADMMPCDNKFVKYQITKFLLEELTDDMISSMLDIFTLDDEDETESEDEGKQKEGAKRERSPDVTLKNLDQSALFYLDRSGGQKPEAEEETSLTEEVSSLTNTEMSTLSSNNRASLLDEGEENEEKEIFIEIVSDSCDSETEANQILLPEVTAHLQTEDWEMMSPVIGIEAKAMSRKSQSQKQRKNDSELENDVLQLGDETELGTPKRSRRSTRINQDTEIKSSGEPLENLSRKRQNTEPICINDEYDDKSVELPPLRKCVDCSVVSSSDDKSCKEDTNLMSARKRGRKSLESHSLSAKLEDDTDRDDFKNTDPSSTVRTRKRMSCVADDSDKSAAVNTRSRMERRSDILMNKKTQSNSDMKQDTSSGDSNNVDQLSISELSTSSNSNGSSCGKVDHTLGYTRRKRTVSELSNSSISSRTRHRMSGVSKSSVIDLTVPEDTPKILSMRSSRTGQSAPDNSVNSVIPEKTVDESDIEILELNTDDENGSTEVAKSRRKSTSKMRGKINRKSSMIQSLPPDEAVSEVDDEVVLKKKKNDTQTKRVSQRLRQQKKNDVL